MSTRPVFQGDPDDHGALARYERELRVWEDEQESLRAIDDALLVKAAEEKLAEQRVLLVKQHGASILFGNGIPDPSEGVDGQGWLDWTTLDLYLKVNGQWELVNNLGAEALSGGVGPQGPEGPAGPAGSTTWLGLTDTDPVTYVGQGGEAVRVNAGETGLEFFTPSAGVTDHGALTGLVPDDDHTQYLLLAGRAGGQTAIGGTAASEELELRGSTDANLGIIRMQSPVQFDAYTISGEPYAFQYNAIENPVGAFIGGGLSMQGTITTAHSTFIYESFRGAPTINSGVAPGFAAYTVLQALPVLNAGALGTANPLAPLILNAGPRVNNSFSGVRTTATIGAINFAPTVAGGAFGATMNVTSITGLICAPKYSTVGGSAINFGTIRGLHMQNPAAGLFQPGAGTENMTAYIGLDMDQISFGNTGDIKAAVRSAMTPATNRYFLLNNGNAVSDFGSGHIYFDDNGSVAFGGVGVTNFDVIMNWQAAGYLRIFFGSSGDDLRWSSPSADRFLFDNIGGSTTGQYNFNCHKFSMGAQIGAVGQQVGVFVAGPRSTEVNGGWADFLLTQGGNLTIDHTMSDVSAWVINPIALTGGTGSITGYVAGLTVGMTTSGLGGAETHALRIQGRRTNRGVDAFEPLSPAALTGNVNDYAPATGNSMRQVWRVVTDAGGNRTITGIAVQQGSDTQWVVNVSPTDSILLTHQDGASAASNRIITPTGATWTLAPDEAALLWHDTTTDRWRILYSTGA